MENHLVVGLTHVDLGWKEGRAEMAAILDQYLEYLCEIAENTADFHYLLEQALHYKDLLSRNPELFERVRKLVRAGILEFATGVASTIENNVVDGESFVRNIQLGTKWIREHFGVEVENCSLIDTFGFPPQMPQILRQFGYDCLLANRLGGRQWEDVFTVKGLDGSMLRLIGRDCASAYVKPGTMYFKYYKEDMEVRQLFDAAEKTTLPFTIVMPYTENEHFPSMETLRCIAESDKGYRMATLKEAFEAVRKLPLGRVVSADLNPEFSGTYSLRHRLRLINRRCEYMLLQAEKICAVLKDDSYNPVIEACWWEMAYTQFHDIITGSHPTKVYLDCLQRMDKIQSTAAAMIQKALSGGVIAGVKPEDADVRQLTVFNGLPFGRTEAVSWKLPPEWSGVSKVMVDGEIVSHQQLENTISFPLYTDALEAVPVVICEGKEKVVSRKRLEYLENDHFIIECGRNHVVDRIFYKPANQVLMEKVDDLLVIQQDNGNFQIEEPIATEIPCAAGSYDVDMYEENSVRVARITGTFPALNGDAVRYVLLLSISEGRPSVDISVSVNWYAEGMRLRLKLPTQFRMPGGIYEVPFGTVERQPYGITQNSRGEWPAFRFVAVEDDNNQNGLALINQGVAGVECCGGNIYTTLLRAPVTEYAGMIPDDTSSDHGEHSFDFRLYAYSGGWASSSLLSEAQAYNSPLYVLPESAVRIPSYLSLKGKNVLLSALRQDGEGRTVIRCYESAGRNETIELNFQDRAVIWRSDLREQPLALLAEGRRKIRLELKPFEIMTILLESCGN